MRAVLTQALGSWRACAQHQTAAWADTIGHCCKTHRLRRIRVQRRELFDDRREVRPEASGVDRFGLGLVPPATLVNARGTTQQRNSVRRSHASFPDCILDKSTDTQGEQYTRSETMTDSWSKHRMR